jgi:hypothetical protein
MKLKIKSQVVVRSSNQHLMMRCLVGSWICTTAGAKAACGGRGGMETMMATVRKRADIGGDAEEAEEMERGEIRRGRVRCYFYLNIPGCKVDGNGDGHGASMIVLTTRG